MPPSPLRRFLYAWLGIVMGCAALLGLAAMPGLLTRVLRPAWLGYALYGLVVSAVLAWGLIHPPPAWFRRWLARAYGWDEDETREAKGGG